MCPRTIYVSSVWPVVGRDKAASERCCHTYCYIHTTTHILQYTYYYTVLSLHTTHTAIYIRLYMCPRTTMYVSSGWPLVERDKAASERCSKLNLYATRTDCTLNYYICVLRWCWMALLPPKVYCTLLYTVHYSTASESLLYTTVYCTLLYCVRESTVYYTTLLRCCLRESTVYYCILYTTLLRPRVYCLLHYTTALLPPRVYCILLCILGGRVVCTVVCAWSVE
jgi:hypothetical protein